MQHFISQISLLYPSLKAGIFDAFGASGLLNLLVYLILIHWILKKHSRLLNLTLCYLVAVSGMYILISCGVFDSVIVSDVFDVILDVIYLVLAIVAINVAVKLFRDWYQAKASPTEFENSYAFLENFSKESKDYRDSLKLGWKGVPELIRCFFILFFVGFAVAFVICWWPQNDHIMVMFMHLFLPGNMINGVWMFLAYGLGFMYPLFLFLLIVRIVLHYSKVVRKIYKFLPILLLFFSALFLGGGLSYFFLLVRKLFLLNFEV